MILLLRFLFSSAVVAPVRSTYILTIIYWEHILFKQNEMPIVNDDQLNGVCTAYAGANNTLSQVFFYYCWWCVFFLVEKKKAMFD